ncbi:unnamed protein product [Ambrosiozyma monospora]|uniref:Unnamed protein product n=1 Tax=Ambrosiozyma monospora TaxID=43982 RepID=A0ACB5TRT3_AMBMO|nr:unnamed protein product [Ambrosiozyma monospora]
MLMARAHHQHKIHQSPQLALLTKFWERSLISEFEGPSRKVPKDLAVKVAKKIKKDKENAEANTSSTGAPGTVNTNVNTSSNNNNNNSHNQQPQRKKKELESVEFIGTVVLNPQISFSNIRITVPSVKTFLVRSLADDDSVTLEVKNGNGHESQPTRISVMKKVSSDQKRQLFVDFIPRKVHLATGAGSYWAVSTTNGQLITYTDSGRRLLPPIILGSPLSFLEIKNQYLMAVTSIGELYVWDLKQHKSTFKPTSLYPLLQPIYRSSQIEVSASSSAGNANANGGVNTVEQNGLIFVNGELLARSENLTMCSITSNGIPIVTLSNGNGYLFNHEMNSWSLVSDSWWAFGSQYWDSTGSLSRGADSLMGFLEANTNEEILRKGKGRFFSKISKVMLMREGYENLETVISLNHLENKITIYN